jgi:tetratricopeptide (TPR) repeat protein
MQCQKCNNELEVDSKFCMHCGTPVSAEVIAKMNDEKPMTKTKVFLLKTLAFFIAVFLTMIIKLFLMAVGFLEFSADFMKGGILLLLALWLLLNGFFLKDAGKKKWGAGLLGAYLVLSIAFGYFYNNSDFGVEQQIIELGSNTPKKIDENMEFSSVKMDGDTVLMDYKLLNASGSDIAPEKINDLKSTIKSESCKDESFAKIIEHGKNITISYYGNDNNLILNVQVSKNDCNADMKKTSKTMPPAEAPKLSAVSNEPISKAEENTLSEASAYGTKGSNLREENPKKSIFYYTKAIELNPSNDAYYINRGIAYDNLHQYAKALNDYNHVIEKSPDSYIYIYRARTYTSLHQYQKALNDYNLALKLSPNDRSIYGNRASCYWAIGNMKKAKSDANKACTLGDCFMKKEIARFERENAQITDVESQEPIPAY